MITASSENHTKCSEHHAYENQRKKINIQENRRKINQYRGEPEEKQQISMKTKGNSSNINENW